MSDVNAPAYSHGGSAFNHADSLQSEENYYSDRNSSFSGAGGNDYSGRFSAESSPMMMSPWNNPAAFRNPSFKSGLQNFLLGSLVREEGHIYSLAAAPGDLLYTGSDSKNIRVWRDLKEFSAFKSSSGLVKAIVIFGEKIFTGHQDGKIRVWKASVKNQNVHKRSGSLPTLKDIFKSSIKPSNYVEAKRKRSVLWIKHSDAISCLSLNEEQGLLYSGSWDRTFKVWRISDSKCLESVAAHDDAVNSVVSGSGGLVFTGSADGTVKVWRKEMKGKSGIKHALVQTLVKQEMAVTALAVDPAKSVLYSGSSDGLVRFWERDKDLEQGGVLRGHRLAVLCLAATTRLVLSGSADNNVCVWRRDAAAVHTCLAVLAGHTGPVKCLAAEEDGERWKVYSGSLDKSVKVWSVSEQMDGDVGELSFRSDRGDQ